MARRSKKMSVIKAYEIVIKDLDEKMERIGNPSFAHASNFLTEVRDINIKMEEEGNSETETGETNQ